MNKCIVTLLIVAGLNMLLQGQNNRRDTVFFCHDTVQPSDASKIKRVEIYREFCSFEELAKLRRFYNTEALFINSCNYDSVPICLFDFPYLKSVEIINCPNFDYEKILNKIKNKKIVHLELYHDNINKISPLVFQLKDLEYLGMYGNKITRIPKEIFDLKNLKELDLSDNKIRKIPSGWDSLKKIKYIDLSENSSLFKKRRNMIFFKEVMNSSIVEMSINNTGLSVFPVEILKMDSLVNIDIRDNKFNKIPYDPDGFKSIKIINAKGTKLKEYPEQYKKYITFPEKKKKGQKT